MGQAPPFVPLDALASELGLPRQWARREAEAGRIPSLLINGRRLFDVETVRRVLLQRISKTLDSESKGGKQCSGE